MSAPTIRPSPLELQVNPVALRDDTRSLMPYGILFTPAIGEKFWLFRVPVSDKQAVVGFPKFGLIGIGFQHEEDWNTNLPSGCEAEKIYRHIAHNKGDSAIRPTDCIEAIKMIQAAVEKLRGEVAK